MSFIKKNLISLSLKACLGLLGVYSLQLNAAEASITSEAVAPQAELTSEERAKLLEIFGVEQFIFEHINTPRLWKKIKEFYEQGFTCSYKDERGCTVLHYAALQGNADAVKLILQHSDDLKKIVSETDSKGQTALHNAIWCFYGSNATGARKVIEELIIAGASFDVKDEGGDTPLTMMAKREDSTIEAAGKKILQLFSNAYRILEMGSKANLPADCKERFFPSDLLPEEGEESDDY